jgi:hypothetical protein
MALSLGTLQALSQKTSTEWTPQDLALFGIPVPANARASQISSLARDLSRSLGSLFRELDKGSNFIADPNSVGIAKPASISGAINSGLTNVINAIERVGGNTSVVPTAPFQTVANRVDENVLRLRPPDNFNTLQNLSKKSWADWTADDLAEFGISVPASQVRSVAAKLSSPLRSFVRGAEYLLDKPETKSSGFVQSNAQTFQSGKDGLTEVLQQFGGNTEFLAPVSIYRGEAQYTPPPRAPVAPSSGTPSPLLVPQGLSPAPPPIPAEEAPPITREYLLANSTTSRAEAEAEADRILAKYNITYPNAKKDIADIAQLYSPGIAEQQFKALYAKENIDLDKYAIPDTPAGKALAERNAAEAAMLRSINPFQPTGIPQFDFAAQPQQPFAPQNQQFQFQPQDTFQPGFQPQFQGPAARPLITQAERPTLDQAIQFIESGGMSPRAGALPMQPMTYGELGSFMPQAQPFYPVQPVDTGIGQMVREQLTPTQALPVTAGTYYDYAAAGTPPAMMREGGSVAQEARGLASLGRGGDSMLVHMTPSEVAGLQSLATQMGGSLSVNPETGLPEANFFKKILPLVAAVAAPYLAPFAATLGMSGAALTGGLAGLGTMLGGGKFKEGIMAGLGAYGSAALTSNMMGSNPLGAGGQQSTFNLANTFGTAAASPGAAAASPGTAAPKFAEGMGGVSTGGLTADELLASGRGELLAPPIEQAALTPPPAAPPPTQGTKIFGMSPSTALLGGTMIAGLTEGDKERKVFEQQEAERRAEEERRRQLGMAAFQRSLGQVPMGAGGGLVALAQGGMPTFEYGGTTAPTGEPRMVQGAGDGMSDNVPATIEGVQEARLANDEFVVPADVVADIGNGSSSAGAKKLYAMMDKIRSARHGTTKQPPEIDAEKYMPV